MLFHLRLHCKQTGAENQEGKGLLKKECFRKWGVRDAQTVQNFAIRSRSNRKFNLNLEFLLANRPRKEVYYKRKCSYFSGWEAGHHKQQCARRCWERMELVSQTTKRALEASLKKLLLQKPLNKITINDEVAGRCDLIFLAVKPQMMEALLTPLKFTLAERPGRFVLCSMAAGLPISRIQELAGEDYPVIRIMPNTPASVGEGMIQYCSSHVTAEEEAEFCKLMAPAGRLDPVPETLIDAASCVSGCGPAWVYQFIEALADGGVACGLPRAKAQEYAAQMVLGSAKLVLESGKHPGELKDAVCSPGGSTIQGVRVLEEQGFRGAVMDAVLAAYDRTREMGKG